MELEQSESLSRAREQHENVVMATKKRHEEDMARLMQKLDDLNNSLMWKVRYVDIVCLLLLCDLISLCPTNHHFSSHRTKNLNVFMMNWFKHVRKLIA